MTAPIGIIKQRDHGGGLDAAIRQWGGTRTDWIDLSTGINPVSYPLPEFPASDWSQLPDKKAQSELIAAARNFWQVPEKFDILAAPGASSLIAALPGLFSGKSASIRTPTYNEHAAAFQAHGWEITPVGPADATVCVHPNNPDGLLWTARDLRQPNVVIDESFADVDPSLSLIDEVTNDTTIVLKSFGKFWGLAGLRLGFAIGAPELIKRLQDRLGPWAVSGPALRAGTAALHDHNWARATRLRLARDADRLDDLMTGSGHKVLGGTTLFRLYETASASGVQDQLANSHIWSRTFPYSDTWVRLGLPGPGDWARIEKAMAR